jgi:hypothetical protein
MAFRAYSFLLVLIILIHTCVAVRQQKVITLHVPTTSNGVQDAFDSLLNIKKGNIKQVDIILDEGVHHLSNSVVLNSSHTQNVDKISISSSVKTNPSKISGGLEVPNESWEIHLKTKDKIIWKAPLPLNANVGSISNRLQAWRGDKRLQIARSPLYFYKKVNSTTLWYAPSQVLPKYYDQESVLFVMYESWTASFHQLRQIDTKMNTVTFKTKFNSQWANQASGRRYYIINAIELLDSINEFYIDSIEREMYLCTSIHDNPSSKSSEPVTIAQQIELFHFEGESLANVVKNVDINNLIFSHSAVEIETCLASSCDGQSASFLTTASLHFKYSNNIVVENCKISGLGGYAIWLDRGAAGNIIYNNTIDDLGGGGIRIGEPAANIELANANQVSNNVITNGGHIYQMGCGVLCQNAKDILISSNEISYFRYTGVSTGWTWGYGATLVSNITTAYNHIHHIGLGYLSDMGCVYTLGHQPNSIIRNNLCHDVQSYNYGGWGYYTDEGSRDERFINNIALRTKCAGHHQHYGTDNVLENNIYYNVNVGDVVTPGRSKIIMNSCDTAIRSSQHNRNVLTCHPNKDPKTNCCCHPGCDQGKCSSFNFTRNIILQPNTYNGTYLGCTVPFGLENFTFMKNLYWIVGTDMNKIESMNLFNDTIGYKNGVNFNTWTKLDRKDDNTILANPELNTSNFKFDNKNSPAITKIGFQPIDISKIGPIRRESYIKEMIGIDAVKTLSSDALKVIKTSSNSHL